MAYLPWAVEITEEAAKEKRFLVTVKEMQTGTAFA